MNVTDVLLLAVSVLLLAEMLLATYFRTHPLQPPDDYWKRTAVLQSLAVDEDRERRYWDSTVGRERMSARARIVIGMSLSAGGHIWRGGKNG